LKLEIEKKQDALKYVGMGLGTPITYVTVYWKKRKIFELFSQEIN